MRKPNEKPVCSGRIYANGNWDWDTFQFGYATAASLIAKGKADDVQVLRDFQSKRRDYMPFDYLAGIDAALADSSELDEIFQDIDKSLEDNPVENDESEES